MIRRIEKIDAETLFNERNYSFLAKHLPPIGLHAVPRMLSPGGAVEGKLTGKATYIGELHKITRERAEGRFNVMVADLVREYIVRNPNSRPVVLLLPVQKMSKPFSKIVIRINDTRNPKNHGVVTLSEEKIKSAVDEVMAGKHREITELVGQDGHIRIAILNKYKNAIARHLWRLANDNFQRKISSS